MKVGLCFPEKTPQSYVGEISREVSWGFRLLLAPIFSTMGAYFTHAGMVLSPAAAVVTPMNPEVL